MLPKVAASQCSKIPEGVLFKASSLLMGSPLITEHALPETCQKPEWYVDNMRAPDTGSGGIRCVGFCLQINARIPYSGL